MQGILGKKLGMTRVIQDDGRVIPITVIECQPNKVTQIKTVEKDGYPAVVLGFGELAHPTKTRKFHNLKEFPLKDGETPSKGEDVTIEIFTEGEEIGISGMSKGKGFQGVVKRHHMKGGPASHGSHFKREPGSVGARAKPGKIHKGKRMAGHMGYDRITQRSKIVYIDKKLNLIGVVGSVPGGNKSVIELKKLN